MSPETFEALKDCEKASRKILRPGDLLEYFLGTYKRD